MYCTSKRSILLSVLIQYVSLDRSAVAFSQFGMQSSIARSGKRAKALWVSRVTEEEMLDSAVTSNKDEDSTKSGSVSQALWVLRGKEVEMLGSAVAPKQDNDGSFPQGQFADFENWLEEEHKEWEEQQNLPVSNEEARTESVDSTKQTKNSFVTGITSLYKSFFKNKSPTKKQKQKRTNATPAISFEEDLMLTIKIIQDHAVRSSTVSTEQYVQQQKAVAGVAEKQGKDVSVPYDAAARLAYEKAGSPGDDYDAFKEKYLSDTIDMIKRKNGFVEKEEEETIPQTIDVSSSISFEEDLMLTIKVIQDHADRSSTVSTEQYIQQQKAVLGVVGKQKKTQTIDVSVPYDAAALLAYEKAGSPGDDFDAYKQQYEAAMVELVKAKKAGMSVNTVLRSFGILDSSKAKPYKPRHKLAEFVSGKAKKDELTVSKSLRSFGIHATSKTKSCKRQHRLAAARLASEKDKTNELSEVKKMASSQCERQEIPANHLLSLALNAANDVMVDLRRL